MNRVIIVFAKEPIAGQVKTRLTPSLSAESAAQLYESFLRDVLRNRYRDDGYRYVLALTPPSAVAGFGKQFSDRWEVIPQVQGGLGTRMAAALQTCLRDEGDLAVITNSDSPDLPRERIDEAFEFLSQDSSSTVLGPDDGGGYYLIGQGSCCDARVFEGVTMGVQSVLERTLSRAGACGIRIRLLAPYPDIDHFQDLVALKQRIEDGQVPASMIPETLQSLRRLDRVGNESHS